MADEKIWFIYLTDHHEGPFTVAEVAEKAKQGLVNGQSLAWKDGMPEWVAAETIPELKPAFGAGAAPAPAAAGAAAPASEFSLAQMLANSQGGEAAVVEPAVADVSMAAPMQESPSSLTSVASLALSTGNTGFTQRDPAPNEEVWTLKIGSQVSGLHTQQKLIQLASEGEIPADAMLWHAGWQDFQPVASVPAVASARKPRKAGATQLTKTGMTGGPRPGSAKPAGLAPITAGANVGDDEPTDPGIMALDEPEEKGFKKILGKLKAMFQKKPKGIAAPSAIGNVMGKGGKTGATGGIKKGGAVAASAKRLVVPVLAIFLIAGAGAGYFLFLASPLPSDLDVLPSDLETMVETVKQDASQPRLFAALAKGTEENPADDTNPKFYVASNLPEGTAVTLQITGEPGTLVNKIRFEKSFTATIGASKLAVFDQVKDDGKPLPMGDYKIKISAEGAPALDEARFLGGKKGAVYDRRLKQYKEKLQGEYDKEMAELRQFIETLKSMQGEVSKKIADYKAGVANPAMRSKLAFDWKNYSANFQGMATQFEGKVKERMNAAGEEKYYPRAYQDIASTLAQLIQLAQLHGTRVEGGTPASNPDELEGLVQAGVVSQEQWLAAAVVKSPFDALKESAAPAAGGAAPPHAAAPAAAAPAAAVPAKQ